MTFDNNTDPLFNGSFHYLKLLGDLIAVTTGFLVNNDMSSYRNCLCAWYNEVIYRVELKQGKEITKPDIDALKKVYKVVSEAENVTRPQLETFHRALNTVTHKAKLRMTNQDTFSRGWMKEG